MDLVDLVDLVDLTLFDTRVAAPLALSAVDLLVEGFFGVTFLSGIPIHPLPVLVCSHPPNMRLRRLCRPSPDGG